jgi:hypothetical protein
MSEDGGHSEKLKTEISSQRCDYKGLLLFTIPGTWKKIPAPFYFQNDATSRRLARCCGFQHTGGEWHRF